MVSESAEYPIKFPLNIRGCKRIISPCNMTFGLYVTVQGVVVVGFGGVSGLGVRVCLAGESESRPHFQPGVRPVAPWRISSVQFTILSSFAGSSTSIFPPSYIEMLLLLFQP